MSANQRYASTNRARRHFLGVAIAAGVKVAAIGAVTAAVASTPAYAIGNRWWKRGGGKGDRNGGFSGGTGPVGGTRDSDGGDAGGSPSDGANCYLRGTAIKTPTGEIAVEELRIGDLIETVSGETSAIRWIGRQTFKKSGHSWNQSILPVCVARHALGQRTPRRDLFLSPNHALYIDGVLIRVKELVNGVTIAPAPPNGQETIQYFSIVLDTHAAVLAEGAPAESFLFRGNNHERFANFAEYERLYPPAGRRPMKPLAPILGYEGGREHLKALLLLAVSQFADVNDPIQVIYKRIANRAEQLASC